MKHTIYMLGPEESFSDHVVRKSFPEGISMLTSSFDEIIAAVEHDLHALGVLALENSLTSSVHRVVDLLYTHSVAIVGEAYMRIELVVAGVSGLEGKTIQKIYSHPQALAQCSRFLATSKAIQIATTSTSAIPPHDVLREVPSMVICSEALARKKGLHIYARNISNDPNNITRFVFVSQQTETKADNNKATFMFKVPHVPGSLVAVLAGIASRGGNLTKIESRPLPGTDWEYRFWIDVEIDPLKLAELSEFVQTHTLESRCVGVYTKGRQF